MADKRKFEQPGVDSNTVAELSKKLLEANAKLQAAEQERKLMLENISHDLRAPLTAIRSAIDYLKQINSDESGKLDRKELDSMLGMIDNRTSTLEVLIRDLYYLTSVESQKADFNFEKVPLGQFLEEYYFGAEIDSRYQDNELVLNIADDYSAIVSMDVLKMQRVLDNLFTNAHKYSDKGGLIELGAYDKDDMACLYVRDNGIGIPKESLEHIFDRTYRVSGARTPSRETSSGLGLAIVKSIVEKHNGRILCESKENQGSVFTVMLPRCI